MVLLFERGSDFLLLRSLDKEKPCEPAHSHMLHLDATWKSYRNASPDRKISLARLEAAGLQPGDGGRYPDLDPVTDFIGRLVGHYDRDEEPEAFSLQDKLSLNILSTRHVSVRPRPSISNWEGR